MKKVGTDFVWLVIGPRCWGKGKTLTEAMANARKAAGPNNELKKDHDVYLAPPSVYLNDMGGMTWKKGEAEDAIKVKVVRDGKELPPEEWK